MSEKSILIVEDDPDIRSTLGELLELEGYAAFQAVDGNAAMSWLETNAAPDLILLDLTMPGLCGREFIALKKRNSRWADVPILVLSASNAADAAKLGVEGILRKPVLLLDLLEAVTRLSAGTSPLSS